MNVTQPPRGVFAATISDVGKLSFADGERRCLDRWLQTLRGRAVDVTVVEHEATRSTRANAYYWACVVAPACAHTGDEPEDFHDEMCARFLTRRQITVTDYATGAAEEIVIPGRSSKLPISDFYHFVEQVRQFIGEFLGVTTDDPDPAYWSKRHVA